jgi:hypothetical protein
MAGSDEEVIGRHAREPWGQPGDKSVFVHCGLAQLKGKTLPGDQRKQGAAQYRSAKRDSDFHAAGAIVRRCVNDETMDRIVDAVWTAGEAPTIVPPHPPFFDGEADGHRALSQRYPPNALPDAYVAHLENVLGGTVDTDIVQAARVGRTELKQFPRFLWQPRFEGGVRAGAPYIVADDVMTMGGTLAALRSHIVKGGGRVIAVTALAHAEGFDQPFAVREQTLSQLLDLYGNGLSELWKERIGHDPRFLTENEGQSLVRWGLAHADRERNERLQLLRDRLAEAAAKAE